jgi:hypothetical protein
MTQQLLEALDRHGLQSLNTYELVVLVAALARLRHSPKESWLSNFFRLSEPRLKDCGTGNLATLMRAVSKLNLASWDIKAAAGYSDWMGSVEALTLRRMSAFRGDEMVRMIAALADLRHRPQGE